MKTLFHRCGQALDVADKLGPKPNSNEFVFLDLLTGDGLDRCPACERPLKISDFTCQPKLVVSHAKPESKPTHRREAKQLIKRARAIATRNQVAA